MSKILAWILANKTYAVAILAVLGAIGQYLNPDSHMTVNELLAAIMVALGISAHASDTAPPKTN